MTAGSRNGQLPDEAARERVRTELDVNFLVEAGAGTGKTRLLVDRVQHLITSGTARLRNIVAITFTEKAAAELRVQIRQRIEGELRSGTDAARDRLRAALADLEIAPISTIHAFAADLLHERPVEAGVDPLFTVIDELQASLFRTEAWDRWLERQKDEAREPLRDAIEYGVRLDQLRTVGDALLRYRDVFMQTALPLGRSRGVLPGSGMMVELDRGPRPQDPVDWLRSKAEPFIRQCIGRIAPDCTNRADKAVRDLEALGRTLDLFARLAPEEVRRSVLAEALKLKIDGIGSNWRPGVLTKIKDGLLDLRDDIEGMQAAFGHWVAIGAINWLGGYVEEYQRLKAREGVLDFDDLLLTARNLLRDNREVRADFQQRFEAILVDEFQDTDPLQAEIIFYLAEAHSLADRWTDVRLTPGKLFIVGDPKQSIYAFRRADIETYELAKQVLSRSGEVQYITANFRSVAEILEAVNKTFTGQMTPPPDGLYQPGYIPLEPSMRTKAAETQPLILLYPDPSIKEQKGVAAARTREAETLAAYLRRRVDEGVWQFGNVALLFRGMTDVPIYEDALKRYEIPYRVTSSRTFYKREEVGWLLNVLHAIEHPTDPVAVWGALRSPLFGCSDREVYEFLANGGSFDYRGAEAPGSIRAAFDVLTVLHANRNLWSVPRMVEEVLVRTSALPIFLLTPQGEQRVANLTKVVTLARALEASGILTFRAFVHWLRDMEEQAVDEAESPTVEEGDNVVRIMSIHAAKGLEFPVVFIPDLGRKPGGQVDNLLLQRVKGESAAYVGKVAGAWPIQTANYKRLKLENDARDAAEQLRVLYVAMTRAKNALVLPVWPDRPAHSMIGDLAHILPLQPKFGEIHKGWLMVDGADVPKIAEEPAPVRLRLSAATTPDGTRLADERAGWLAAREAALSSSGTADRVVLPSRLIDPDKLAVLKGPGARLEVSRGGRALGTLVHDVLAVIPLDRPDLADDYAQYFARAHGIGGRIPERAAAMVRAALETPLVKMALAGQSWREVPFAAREADGAVMEGTMDLLVQTADGKVIVADWKTDTTAPEKREAVMSLYAPQLDAYDAVLKRLGFESEQRLILLGT